MKPTPEQIAKLHECYSQCQGGHAESLLTVISHWESIRPKDQVTRTNHELARLLTEALEENNQLKIVCAHQKSTHQDLESVMQDYDKRGQQLKAALDEIERLNAPTVGPAELLTFPDPPHGWEWWNPNNLTPDQVGLHFGWRLCCGEEIGNLPDEGWIGGKWQRTASFGDRRYKAFSLTCRTKAPLPAPKPTPEEIERAEFEVWWNIDQVFRSNQEMAFGAWKAAKKGLTTP